MVLFDDIDDCGNVLLVIKVFLGSKTGTSSQIFFELLRLGKNHCFSSTLPDSSKFTVKIYVRSALLFL
jgi:hypothetical protein